MSEPPSERWVCCHECGALEGAPCVALGTSRYRERGAPINGFHVKRTMRMRELYAPTSTNSESQKGDG